MSKFHTPNQRVRSSLQTPDPDYNDPFGPDPKSERLMACLHCGQTFKENQTVWAKRSNSWLWHCPNPDCSGAGIGYDILPADSKTGLPAQDETGDLVEKARAEEKLKNENQFDPTKQRP